MTEHNMKLFPQPFQMIRSGEKTIELRLYDEKRRKIHVGDRIRFTNTEAPEQTLTAEVENLFVFDSFAALYRALPLRECGYTEEDIGAASPADMDAYYPKARQDRYGVVGIQIRLLPDGGQPCEGER